jgi:hypothetical protein
MLFCLQNLLANATVASGKTQLVLVDHQDFTVWTSVLPMPLGQTAQSIKAQQPVEILH